MFLVTRCHGEGWSIAARWGMADRPEADATPAEKGPSTDGQSVEAQVKHLRAAGAAKVLRETASGARADRVQLRRALAQLATGDVLLVTRLDRLVRSTRDLLNTLAAIADRGARFRSLADAWADTTTAHGRLILTRRARLATMRHVPAIPPRRAGACQTHDTAALMPTAARLSAPRIVTGDA
jgi:hypothetical protein